MKASANDPAAPDPSSAQTSAERERAGDGIDISLLEESLSRSVWERMLANDDALRLADLLQSAVLKSRAKPERTDAPSS